MLPEGMTAAVLKVLEVTSLQQQRVLISILQEAHFILMLLGMVLILMEILPFPVGKLMSQVLRMMEMER